MHKQERRFNIIVAIVFGMGLLSMPGCSKDGPRPPLCERFYNEEDMRGCAAAGYATSGSQYASPSINPNNGDEFVVVEDGRLVKHNIETDVTTTLVEGLSTILTPDWGASNWIVFSAGWKIWKVNQDGTGLTQLSTNPRDLYPKFNPAGDRIIHARNMELSGKELDENPELRKLYKMMVLDLDGNPVDSFCRVLDQDQCYPLRATAWSQDNILVGEWGPNNDLSKYGIALYDLDGTELEVLYDVERDRFEKGYPFINDIEWHPDGIIYFRDDEGLKCLDPDKKSVKRLKKSCGDEYYEGFSITPDGEHIIIVRGSDVRDRETCIITEHSEVVRMRVNGSREEVILDN